MTGERAARIQEYLRATVLGPNRASATNIRGTSGSGKSHIVHQLIREAREKGWLQPHSPGGKTIGYTIYQPDKRPIEIIGPYETACGGCDAFSQRGCLDVVYDMVERAVTVDDHHVIFEGLIVCADFQRTVDLTKLGFPLQVCLLNATFEQCRDRCNERRAQKGTPPLDENGLTNLRQKYDGNVRSVPRFKEAGVDVLVGSAADIVQVIREKMY